MKQLQYIVNHDEYRDNELTPETKGKTPGYTPPAKTSKKGRKLAKRQKDAKRKRSISRVLNLIDELESMKS